MPSSNLNVAARVLNMVETALPHRTILDVGPGWGKYATLLREYLNVKPEQIDAVEAWGPYIIEHRLGTLYDSIVHADVRDLTDANLAAYDLVLMVDVLEHLTHDDGRDLLRRIPGWVIVCTPVAFFENDRSLPPTEQHLSQWTADDFESMARCGRYESYLGGHLARLRPIRGTR